MPSRLKCDDCGRFISHDDLVSGEAMRELITPDSAWTKEDYWTLCPPCRKEAFREKTFNPGRQP